MRKDISSVCKYLTHKDIVTIELDAPSRVGLLLMLILGGLLRVQREIFSLAALS